MGQYKVLLSFTRHDKKYSFGDIVDLPDSTPEEYRNIGMLMNYGVIDMAEKKSDDKQK